MMGRRTYVRPMDGWWKRDPFFVRYMAREATAIFVVVYAVTLLAGIARLSQGEASFDAWVAHLRSATSVALHVLLLAVFLYHTLTWFQIMPKTMPPVVIAGRKLVPGTITALGLAASAAASLVLFLGLKAIA
ncbi:MAG: fumarate reductase subunit C [Burkholderiales bacterium]|nr:fumarate reductase subunit C [Burkholderiales bacterium]